MGTKKVKTEVLEGKTAKKNGTHTSKEISPCEDSLVMSAENHATASTDSRKKRSRRHEASVDGVAVSSSRDEGMELEDSVALDNDDTEKSKRESELANQMKGSQEARKKDERTGNGGEAGEANKGLEENHMGVGNDTSSQHNDQMDMMNSSLSEATKNRKMNHKKKESKEKTNSVTAMVDVVEVNREERVAERLQGPEEQHIASINTEEGGNKKKKKKNKRYDNAGDPEATKHLTGAVELDKSVKSKVDSSTEEVKKNKKKPKGASRVALPENTVAKSLGNESRSIEGDGGSTGLTKNIAGERKIVADDTEDGEKGGKKRKRKMDKDNSTILIYEDVNDRRKVMNEREHVDENVMERVEHSEKAMKKKRKKKNHHSVDSEDGSEKTMEEKLVSADSVIGEYEDASYDTEKKEGNENAEYHASNAEGGNKVDKKKVKSVKKLSEGKGSKKLSKNMEKDQATDTIVSGTSKRVSFSEDVEVFPLSDGPNDENAVQEDGLVRGKRFTREEDEKVKEAVFNYINEHNLGENGLEMVMNCRKYPEVKNCWKEIVAALPHRPLQSVYYRAHILFLRDETRKWTQEEYEIVRKFHEKHGPDWKTLADALGKHRFHVKEAWRRIRLPKAKKGRWAQEEYQNLFDLVNKDLRTRAFEEEKKSKHGMLRDNISWMAISSKLETRTDAICCMKWYDQLTSPMVSEGIWSDTDDYHLLVELYNQDALCMEDVDWDNLLEHRSGDVCRKRWNQMVRHLGEHANDSFPDQIEILLKRYCPDVLEAREAYNSKPVAP